MHPHLIKCRHQWMHQAAQTQHPSTRSTRLWPWCRPCQSHQNPNPAGSNPGSLPASAPVLHAMRGPCVHMNASSWHFKLSAGGAPLHAWPQPFKQQSQKQVASPCLLKGCSSMLCGSLSSRASRSWKVMLPSASRSFSRSALVTRSLSASCTQGQGVQKANVPVAACNCHTLSITCAWGDRFHMLTCV